MRRPLVKTAKRSSSRAASPLTPKHVDPRGRQFERERHAVKPVANLEHWNDFPVAQDKTVRDRQGALVEQLDRRILQRPVGCEIIGARRQLQRREAVPPFALGPQRLPAGGQNGDADRCLEDRLGDCGHRADHVLATVEHDQRMLVPEPSGQSRYRVDAWQGDPKHGAEGARHQVRIGQRGQLDEPNPVLV